MSKTIDKAREDHADILKFALEMISISDRHEDARRKSDRVGGNLFYGKHWNVAISSARSALTVNLSKALIDHKISIMTKQRPVPIVEATDVGDHTAAKLMRSAIMEWWDRDGMQRKMERALYLANSTRSCAIKVRWDPSKHNRAGDITADVIPGWRVIADPRTTDEERMQFAGDRATITRDRAMLLYPQAARIIEDSATTSEQNPGASAAGKGSPIRDPWQKLHLDFPSAGIVNGQPLLLSYTGNNPARSSAGDLVEVVELYFRDRTLVPRMMPVKDKMGNVKQKVSLGEDGMPRFEQAESERRTIDGGLELSLPMFKIVTEDVYEEQLVFKYPHWRRVTILLPDAVVLEDTAWDYPLPYAYCHDGEPLEGFWVKGSILDLETLQGALNVSLSTMMDNLRFSAYRAYIAYNGAMLERTDLNISPGEVIRAGEKGTIEPFPVPEVSSAWFQWVQFIMSLMERQLGATGIMQGEAAGRVDSAAGYDMLAEIGGSRIVKATQRMERTIARVAEIAGTFMQRHYDERHAVQVENAEGELTYERITPGSLVGSFSYRVLTGSSLAWSESAVRARVLQELQQGLRDKISAWKALHIEDWRQIMARMQTESPQLQPAPPPRTRKNIPSKPHPPRAKN